MAVKILQLHKRASYEYKHIQDKYSFSEQLKCYAIADGTTQSFNSELWAAVITENFVKNPTFEAKQLIQELFISATRLKEQQFDFSLNPAKASLEKEKLKKGATSTFIGVKIDKRKQLSIISSGDSNVFIFRDNQFMAFPFTTVERLDDNKHFLNTEKLLSKEVDESFFRVNKIQIENDDVIILATDALSRLLLKNKDSYKEFLEVNDFTSFQNLCLKYWNIKLMEEDDITAIIIQDFDRNGVKEILPPKDFSFPREEEIEFIPSSQMPSSLDNINEHEMQQLLFAVNHINKELSRIKKKSKSHEILLMLAISLIAFNIFIPFYLNPKKTGVNSNEAQQQFNQQLIAKDDTIIGQRNEIEILNKKLQAKDTVITRVEVRPIAKKSLTRPKTTKLTNDTLKKKAGKQTPLKKDSVHKAVNTKIKD